MKKTGKCKDGRQLNNPHVAIYIAGTDAARNRLPLHDCPYVHPAMRNSWFKGYRDFQQLLLPFDSE